MSRPQNDRNPRKYGKLFNDTFDWCKRVLDNPQLLISRKVIQTKMKLDYGFNQLSDNS